MSDEEQGVSQALQQTPEGLSHLKSLLKKRSTIKKRITLFKTFLIDVQAKLNDAKENKTNVSRVTSIDLETRFEPYVRLFADFDKIQSEIEHLHDKEDQQIQYRAEFEESYYQSLSLAKSLIIDCNLLGANDIAKAAAPTSDAGNFNVKLPQIHLPKFNGSYLTWLEFRDTFQSLIHENDQIGDIQKFHYLRSSLESVAAELINTVEFSAVNYLIAWDLLCDRFNNKKLLVHNHLQALFEFTPLQKESSKSLRELLDAISRNLRSLSALQLDISGWDTLIIHLMSSKLDRTTSKHWKEYSTQDELPSLEEFKTFLKGRADLLETLEYTCTQPVKSAQQPNAHSVQRKIQRPFKSFAAVSVSSSCPVCSGDHHLRNCDSFLKQSSFDRLETVKKLQICINCLNGKHLSRNCSSSLCRKCHGRHHTLLHFDHKRSDDSEPKTKTVALATSINRNQNVLLSTAVVQVLDSSGNPHTCRVLLDCGSQSNFITSDLCKRLGLQTTGTSLSVVGINQLSTQLNQRCSVHLQSVQCAFQTTVNCFLIPVISDLLPSTPVDCRNFKIPSHIKLADPHFSTPDRVDILLGASVFWDLLCVGQFRLGTNLPVLQKTKFGWIIAGSYDQFSQSAKTFCNFAVNDEISQQLCKFWQCEELTSFPTFTPDERKCEQIFSNTLSRHVSGRFIVSIPFKRSVSELGDSKEIAERQFLSLERRFQKNPKLKENYIKFMEEYENLGHMSPVSDSNKKQCYYLPHHGVFNKNKIRVVFNGSSPSDSGVSLNDLQYVGPTIQDDLCAIILRFRFHRFVLGADIVKMYRQILIHPDQRCFQKILWRDNPCKPISTYELNTVTYGTASAPYLAIRCLVQLANESESQFPKASDVIRRDFYVDDMLTGTDTVSEAIRLGREISLILNSAGMTLGKWISNSNTILRGINGDNTPENSIHFDDNPGAKTLGLFWSRQSDSLMFSISPSTAKTSTKRSILSGISRIFDPLGLLGPCVIIAKVILQELWSLKLSWDESVPISLHSKWDKFQAECRDLNALKVPRRVVCDTWNRFELHGFCDASVNAYGACVYVRSINHDGNIQTSLLCSKTRVAPLKALSIPRLELCAAALLVKLMEKVVSALHVRTNTICYWSDSTIVLSWIRLPSRQLQTFVGNRVSLIQTLSDPKQWYHVGTHENPADLLSRGVFPLQLINSSFWWSGPQWLSSERSSWPITTIPSTSDDIPEIKKSIKCHVTINKEELFPFTIFSSFIRINRSCAYVLRFIFNCRNPLNKRKGVLSSSELQAATLRLVGLAQKESYPSIFKRDMSLPSKNELARLTPFIDKNGLLRVGGRLTNSQFEYNKKHPVILPAKHHISLLIIRHEHIRLMHAGPQLMLSSLRERFWPVKGRNLARLVVHRCLTCFRAKPVSPIPIMGNLPSSRTSPTYPFHICGVDYAGPVLIKDKNGRGSKTCNAYISVFICFATKAVHIELVSDLTTECFLAAFRRFVSRRGKPLHVYSDNGKTFVGASSELHKLGEFMLSQGESLSEGLANENINWHFIPSYSPHMGGLWEAGVKSCKHHLKRILTNAHLTFEDFYTVLAQIESILNSRPLSPLSSDPRDLEALTPAHFLIGKKPTSLPDPDVSDVPETRLGRYQRLQQLQQHFWRRWSKEYISELQIRTKWHTSKGELSLGSLVLLRQENTPPQRWCLGRIVALHPGNDGVARVATIRTSKGEVKRAFTKICPLPIEHSVTSEG